MSTLLDNYQKIAEVLSFSSYWKDLNALLSISIDIKRADKTVVWNRDEWAGCIESRGRWQALLYVGLRWQS